MASGHILVQGDLASEFTERLAEKARTLPVGDPATGQVALGPLINRCQLDHAKGIVDRSVAAGATLEAGGTHEGFFFAPTVFGGVVPSMVAFEEEVFGPVAPVTRSETDEKAITPANQTEYGLSAGIISRSVSRALGIGNRLRTGLLHINDQTVADDVVDPFGGVGTSGNGTSIGGPANWKSSPSGSESRSEGRHRPIEGIASDTVGEGTVNLVPGRLPGRVGLGSRAG